MKIPQIRLESTSAQISIQTRNAVNHMQQPLADLSIEQPMADLTIKTKKVNKPIYEYEPGKVDIHLQKRNELKIDFEMIDIKA